MAQEPNLKKSQEQADTIEIIGERILLLDIEYLEMAYKDMVENHNTRDAAAVLDPDPFTHNERQDSNAARLDKFRLILDLAKNRQKIIETDMALMNARNNTRNMGAMFGM